MTTKEYLESLTVTMDDARTFITSNLNSPDLIFTTVQNAGVTNQMIAEIVGGVTVEQVEAFWVASGYDPSLLNGTTDDSNGTEEESYVFVNNNFSSLLSIININTNEGLLSNDALRSAIVQETGWSAYATALSPSNFIGSSDGVFSNSDLGGLDIGPLPATLETVESLCFGSQINFLKNLDYQEILQIGSFVQLNYSALMTDNQIIIDQFLSIMADAAADTTEIPFFSDDQIADIVTLAGVNIIDYLSGSTSTGFNMMDTFIMNLI